MAEAALPDDASLAVLIRASAAIDDVPRIAGLRTAVTLARTEDATLTALARGRGALEIAIGERLDELSRDGRAMQLSYSSIRDYARERLGIAASTAEKMARFARNLRTRPLLRDAVRSGEVTVRQAEAVMRVAVGVHEAGWVARARQGTVRSLLHDVKEHAGPAEDFEDEEFNRLGLDVPPEARPLVDAAFAAARRQLGRNPAKWRCFESMCHEYGSGHPLAFDEQPGADLATEVYREWLCEQSAWWKTLAQPAVAVPHPIPDPHARAHELDAEVRKLADERARWDDVFGHVAHNFLRRQGWRVLDFETLDHYAEERLGMCARALRQRATVTQKLELYPGLQHALVERRLSYEKVRLIAAHAPPSTYDEWIERAAPISCVELREALQGDRARKMCARGKLEIAIPIRLRGLLEETFAAVRRVEGRNLSPGACFLHVCAHFLEVWGAYPKPRRTVRQQVMERDNHRCQVPGCSRAADDAHHVVFRSHGGKTITENEIAVCRAHHRGIHRGYIRVTGTAPDKLIWRLGVRPGDSPVAMVVTSLRTAA
jgi:hypothetical protein